MPEPVTPPADPAGSPPVTPPADGAPATPDLPKDVQEKLDKADKIAKDFEDYRNKVDPVLETIYMDPETLKDITKKHNIRLGRIQPDAPTDPKTPTQPTPPASDPDLRNSQVNQISEKFEEKMGIDKMPVEKKQEMRGLVGAMIKEMLDPKGNKTIAQVFEEVSLTKLPWYFEKAYDLVTKDDQIKAKVDEAKTQATNEARGVIGGAPSMSIDLDTVTLSLEERKVASNMNISEEDYLKQKKEIIKRRES